jgi:hypothetical protein
MSTGSRWWVTTELEDGARPHVAMRGDRPGDHRAVAAALPGALAEIATARPVQWRLPAFRPAEAIMPLLRCRARAWQHHGMMLARDGMMMPLLRCRARVWHDDGLRRDAGQLYNCVSKCLCSCTIVSTVLAFVAGQPPPRLLAPHVIHCRGIATALAGIACDGSTAKTTHATTHVFAVFLPCSCHVIAMSLSLQCTMRFTCACHDIIMILPCYRDGIAM